MGEGGDEKYSRGTAKVWALCSLWGEGPGATGPESKPGDLDAGTSAGPTAGAGRRLRMGLGGSFWSFGASLCSQKYIYEKKGGVSIR